MLFDTKNDALKVDFPKHKFKTKDVAGKSTLTPRPLLDFCSRDWAWRRRERLSLIKDAGADLVLNDPDNRHVMGLVTKSGYIAEIRLPWAPFEPFYGSSLKPKDGLTVGFDITITDIDGDPPGKYAALPLIETGRRDVH